MYVRGCCREACCFFTFCLWCWFCVVCGGGGEEKRQGIIDILAPNTVSHKLCDSGIRWKKEGKGAGGGGLRGGRWPRCAERSSWEIIIIIITSSPSHEGNGLLINTKSSTTIIILDSVLTWEGWWWAPSAGRLNDEWMRLSGMCDVNACMCRLYRVWVMKEGWERIVFCPRGRRRRIISHGFFVCWGGKDLRQKNLDQLFVLNETSFCINEVRPG